jgi:hypothetical protein
MCVLAILMGRAINHLGYLRINEIFKWKLKRVVMIASGEELV